MTEAQPEQPQESQSHAELLMLYQVTTQDLAFFKQQQWSVTNYVLLLDAAIIGVAQLKSAVSPAERMVLSVLAVVLGIAGGRLLFKLERSIAVGRDRLRNVREALSPRFRDVWLSPHKVAESAEIAVLLGAVLLVGTVAVLWIVWYRGL